MVGGLIIVYILFYFASTIFKQFKLQQANGLHQQKHEQQQQQQQLQQHEDTQTIIKSDKYHKEEIKNMNLEIRQTIADLRYGKV